MFVHTTVGVRIGWRDQTNLEKGECSLKLPEYLEKPVLLVYSPHLFVLEPVYVEYQSATDTLRCADISVYVAQCACLHSTEHNSEGNAYVNSDYNVEFKPHLRLTTGAVYKETKVIAVDD